MAGWQPALVAVVLLAVTLLGPPAASGKSDIVGAVTKQSAKMRGAAKIAIGGGKSAEPRAGGSTLGVKGGSPKQHHYSKKCGTHSPTDKELAAVQPLMDAAAKFSADEDAARSGAALLWINLDVAGPQDQLQLAAVAHAVCKVWSRAVDVAAVISRRCRDCVPCALPELHVHDAGTGDETRLLANEWGPAKKTVNVYWHVLKEGDAFSQGNIPRDAINNQIEVLNDRFSPSHVQFNVSLHHCLSPTTRINADSHLLIPCPILACILSDRLYPETPLQPAALFTCIAATLSGFAFTCSSPTWTTPRTANGSTCSRAATRSRT